MCNAANYLLAGGALFLAACQAAQQPGVDITARSVTLPDGAVIIAEVKITPAEQAQGMMYRTELAHNRGMLFVNPQPLTGAYWMKNCNFPLDIIFLAADHSVVEVAASAPPCREEPCPTFGGHRRYQHVLEINGGDGAKHGVREGVRIGF